MRSTIRATLQAALTTDTLLRYTALSGNIAALVATGHLIGTGDLLDRLGAHDLPDGQRSWYGRHVATAYRAAHNGTDALRVWTQHRTTGRWIHIHVYAPTDPALYTALSTYEPTCHLTA
ncbi:hypothetical protein ACH4VR_29655 [Streptomyces sp. NPDC020883]|uniref:hypothetical protein n=1 Tax=Streptomyces sp. NPDC020883 TaxID=3365099 RepID=UPI00378E9711